MRRIDGHRLGVAQGELVLFSDHDTNGPMWSGDGPREARAHVAFAEAFAEAPVVQVSLSMWDIASGANARVDLKAERVAPDGFAIVFRTWGDTRVARVRVGWLALGTVRDEDHWEVG